MFLDGVDKILHPFRHQSLGTAVRVSVSVMSAQCDADTGMHKFDRLSIMIP